MARVKQNTTAPGLHFDAAIFDMDGVVTNTAILHAAAWKLLFDAYLKTRAERNQEPYRPFDAQSDYLTYVDGKPRHEGIRSFLESRQIRIPQGSPADGPEKETHCGLGNKKDALLEDMLRTQGVQVFDSTLSLIRQLKKHQIRVGIVSSSKHCQQILELAGIGQLFEARVDGVVSQRLGLKGKPDPAIFIKSARLLKADPKRCAVVEDAIAGVQAGRRGGFGLVIGVDRGNNRAALRDHGAHIVVSDLSEIGLEQMDSFFKGITSVRPSALDHAPEIAQRLSGKRAAVFLDHDGTLAPIAARPELARMSAPMQETVRRLARHCFAAVVSGRALADIIALVGIEELHYAGNHGLEIAGPGHTPIRHEKGKEFLPAMKSALERLSGPIGAIAGAFVEDKTFSLSVHYRQVSPGRESEVEAIVDTVLRDLPLLQKHHGKKVFEVRPRLDWNKGKAVLWLLERLGLNTPDVIPIYIGDDVTDEDAFRALAGKGIGIVVLEQERESAADYSLRQPEEVRQFLEQLIEMIEDNHR